MTDKPHSRLPLPARRMRSWFIWLALAAIFAIAAFLLPWNELWSAWLRAQKIWVGAVLGFCLLLIPISATQWRLFMPRRYHLGWFRVFEITSLTATARTTLPFFGGDASSMGLLVVRGGLEKGAALLVLTLDQLFSGIGKVALVCATLVFVPLPPSFAAGAVSLVALVAFTLALLLAASHYGHKLHGLTALLPPRAEHLLRSFANLSTHLEIFRSPWRSAGAAFLALLKKTIEVLAVLAIQQALGIDLPLWSAILLVTALNLSTVIPGPPASLGVFEATMVFVYHTLGVPPGLALAAAVLQHAVNLTPDIGYGYAVLLAAQLRQRLRDAAQKKRISS